VAGAARTDPAGGAAGGGDPKRRGVADDQVVERRAHEWGDCSPRSDLIARPRVCRFHERRRRGGGRPAPPSVRRVTGYSDQRSSKRAVINAPLLESLASRTRDG